MSVFGNFRAGEVVDAAEKFIAKMDENDLSAAIAQSERAMTPNGRRALVESIFDAFRERGESSQDAVEGAGTTIAAIEAGDSAAFASLLHYAQQNAGLLKEAATTFIEHHSEFVAQLSSTLVDGISRKLRAP
ncbi:MAG: hypothetical protein ACXWNK_01430 [Vulcanimicrobiaceae bacterium]